MRRDLLFKLLVLTLSTGCMSYIQQSKDADMAPEVTVSPADGSKHDFLVSVPSDFARLRTAMGSPTAYHEIYFSGVHLDAEVYAGASNREIAKWTMNWDGSITHRSRNAPTDRFDCLDRQPFTVDEATIARLPQVVQDAQNHTGSLDNPKFSSLTIRRATGQFWWCGDVQIAVNFDSDCGAVYKDDDGDRYYDCPTRDVLYDTSGKFLWTTTDPNTHTAFE
ncbi:MAG TPA: hypothetical protein VGJ81_15995 [Thermoanaerobaculia bacterium]|jgi:hypothetical protein